MIVEKVAKTRKSGVFLETLKTYRKSYNKCQYIDKLAKHADVAFA